MSNNIDLLRKFFFIYLIVLCDESNRRISSVKCDPYAIVLRHATCLSTEETKHAASLE